MIRRLQITLLALFVTVWAMASETSVKNADGVEIWYDFDINTMTASVTYKGKSRYTYDDEYIGNVVIPSKVTYKGEEYSVTKIGDDAFFSCRPTSITIPESLTEIGKNAFMYCHSLTSLTIPESVTEIGDYAFRACYKLYEVYNKSNLAITAGSSENGDVAYYAKKVYTDDSGESKLKTVGDYIFYVDEDNIELLVYLGDETAITLPSDYEGKNYKIGDWAFQGCISLTSITIPEGVTEIGENAFSYCYSLTNITLPEGVKSIGGSAFEECISLTSITIPESVTLIGSRAFLGCISLTSITIPEGVTEIGEWAFLGCISLTSITVPESMTSIGDQAFDGCFKLYEVYNKSNLDITAGSSENGDVAYYAKKVYTDDSVESKLHTVGDYIFYLDEYYTELLVYLGDETSITLPSDYEGKDYIIANYGFYGCSSLTNITIPEGVISIGDYAFDGCSSLKSVTIPDDVTSIGNYAFSGCSSLTSITIPEGVTWIGGYAFYGCNSLTSIDVALDNNSYTSIDGVLFSKDQTILLKYPEGKKDVTSYVIPEGVTEIGSSAFEDCSSLKSITIPEGVTEIGYCAFADCSFLTSITIPENVTEIANCAFSDCSSLTSITSMNVTPPSIGNSDTFNGVDKSIPVYVPKQSVEAYKSADGWKEFTNILPIKESVTSGIDNKIDNISVRSIGNNIVVTGTDNYTVYSISGQSLGKVTSVERGIYIVVAEGKSYKVAIR